MRAKGFFGGNQLIALGPLATVLTLMQQQGTSGLVFSHALFATTELSFRDFHQVCYHLVLERTFLLGAWQGQLPSL
jgi:hypothetical protein